MTPDERAPETVTPPAPRDSAADRLGGSATLTGAVAPTVPDAVEDEAAAARARAERYEQLLRLADLFDGSGEDLRRRSRLGEQILRDPDVSDSAELAAASFEAVEEAVRAATSGKRGLLTRSVELDADALVLRATVLTYRWIDDLQAAAFKTLGSIAGRAIGYLAPEVELGGAIVSAGLIETDALDRDGVAAYLNELAENNPELLDHVSSGGGGLVDSLQLRSLLTAGVLAGSQGAAAGRAGLRRIDVAPLSTSGTDALRDVAGDFTLATPLAATSPAPPEEATAPRSLEELMATLADAAAPVSITRVAPDAYIAYLTGPTSGAAVVAGDSSAYLDQVVAAVETTVSGTPGARVMLVGAGAGGVAAVELAATRAAAFTVDQVVTAGAPASHVHRLPDTVRVLSLEDRSDPVALLGSLISHGLPNRVTVLFEGGGGGRAAYVAGGRAADRADQPDLRSEIDRIVALGYLAS
jgi:hypothetical protein